MKKSVLYFLILLLIIVAFWISFEFYSIVSLSPDSALCTPGDVQLCLTGLLGVCSQGVGKGDGSLVQNGFVGRGAHFVKGYFDFGNLPQYNSASTLTFGGWFKNDIPNSGRIISKSDNLGAVQYELYTSATSNKVVCSVGTLSGIVSVTSTSLVTPGVWYNAVCRFDLSSARLQIFINGVPESSKSVSSIINFLNIPLRIGGRYISSGFSASYTGYIDEAFVTGRALTNSEILNLYQSGVSGDGFAFETISVPTQNGQVWNSCVTVSDDELSAYIQYSFDFIIGEFTEIPLAPSNLNAV